MMSSGLQGAMWHGKVNTAVGVQGSLALGTTVSPQASSFLIKGGLITGLSFRGQDWAQKKNHDDQWTQS